MPPFKKARSEMNVENVQNDAGRVKNIGAKAATPLTISPGEIVIPAQLDRQAAERHVAVRTAMQGAVLTETPLVLFEISVNGTRLVIFGRPMPYVKNLLNGHNVGVQFVDHLGDALGAGSPIQASAFVNVVSCDADPTNHC